MATYAEQAWAVDLPAGWFGELGEEASVAAILGSLRLGDGGDDRP